AEVARAIPPLAGTLAAAFWPGPLTLILPRQPHVPEVVTAGGPSVAVRVPSHPVAQGLLRAAGRPIAAPSANRFARPSPTTARHVLDDLEGEVDLVLDAGPVPIGLESTILDLTRTPPAVLRPGGLPVEALRRLIPDLVVEARFLPVDGAAAAAPGQFLKHYSPRARLELIDGARPAALAALRAAVERALARGLKVGVLVFTADEAAVAGLPVVVMAFGPEAEPETAGRRLFAALRELDAQGVDVILARLPARAGLGLAIWDRLYRAAEGRVTAV
ncbi:MAG: L-threonylcarbamoyladenylate synthase, partial [Anaerolineales bacterium]|nr:L-threonylcarbamoyladenylate synthase [Anaerolineales bacterium]